MLNFRSLLISRISLKHTIINGEVCSINLIYFDNNFIQMKSYFTRLLYCRSFKDENTIIEYIINKVQVSIIRLNMKNPQKDLFSVLIDENSVNSVIDHLSFLSNHQKEYIKLRCLM